MSTPTSNNSPDSRPVMIGHGQVLTAPRYRVQLDRITAAAFFNVTDDGRSSQGAVSLSKRFFDQKSSTWKTQRLTLFPSELGATIACLERIQQLVMNDSATGPPH